MTVTDNPGAAVIGLCGWAADRTPGAMAGAQALARGIGARFAGTPILLGDPGPPDHLPWEKALERSRPYLSGVAARMAELLAAGRRPLVVANRCAASLATLPPVLSAHPGCCVVWLDAHGDFNTPDTTASGYLGGMQLTGLCGMWDTGLGKGLDPERLVLAGIRDLDEAEARLLKETGVTLVQPRGGTIDAEAVLRAVGGRPVWIHVDLDVLEPGLLPTEYRVEGGLGIGAVRDLLAGLARTSRILGLEIAEFDLEPDRFERDLETVLSIISPVTRELFGRDAGPAAS
jgi:arginase